MNHDDEAEKVTRRLKYWERQLRLLRDLGGTPAEFAEVEQALECNKVQLLTICENARAAGGGKGGAGGFDG